MARARRILVVEDDAKTAAAIEMYLRHAGFRAEVARTGTDGLAKARAARPDLVILDLMLPGSAASTCARRCARSRTCRSSWSPRARPRTTSCSGSSSAPTTT